MQGVVQPNHLYRTEENPRGSHLTYPEWTPELEKEGMENLKICRALLKAKTMDTDKIPGPDKKALQDAILRRRHRMNEMLLRLDGKVAWAKMKEKSWDKEYILAALDCRDNPIPDALTWTRWHKLPHSLRNDLDLLALLAERYEDHTSLRIAELGLDDALIGDLSLWKLFGALPHSLLGQKVPLVARSDRDLYLSILEGFSHSENKETGKLRKQFDEAILRDVQLHKDYPHAFLRTCPNDLLDDEAAALELIRSANNIGEGFRRFSLRVRALPNVAEALCKACGKNLKYTALHSDDRVVRAACLNTVLAYPMCTDGQMQRRLANDTDFVIKCLSTFDDHFDDGKDELKAIRLMYSLANKDTRSHPDVTSLLVRFHVVKYEDLPTDRQRDRSFWEKVLSPTKQPLHYPVSTLLRKLTGVLDGHLACLLIRSSHGGFRWGEYHEMCDGFAKIWSIFHDDFADPVIHDLVKDTMAEFLYLQGADTPEDTDEFLYILRKYNSPLLRDVSFFQLLLANKFQGTMQFIPHDLQSGNPGLVLDCLRVEAGHQVNQYIWEQYVTQFIVPSLMGDRDFIIKAAVYGADLMPHFDVERYIEDEEVALCWIDAEHSDYIDVYVDQFKKQSGRLVDNREFMRRAVSKNGDILKHFPALQDDHEIMLLSESIDVDLLESHKSPSIKKMEHFSAFATYIRGRIQDHQSFQQAVTAMDSESSMSQLNMGDDTTTVLKKTIAQYLGCDRPEDFENLCDTSVVLTCWGY